MSEQLNEYFAEDLPHDTSTDWMPGWLLNLFSLFLLAGAALVGLLCAVIFIHPQSRFNPLPPSTAADQLLELVPSATPGADLPFTWIPAASPVDIPARTPASPDKPIIVIESPPLFTANLKSGAADQDQISINNLEVGVVSSATDYNLPESPGQIYLAVNYPGADQLGPRFNQPQLASALNIPYPTVETQAEDPLPEEGISDLFTPEVQYWEDEILAWAEEYDLDPNLIATVMQIESCGYSRAKSAAGAMGLFQVMPHHFKNRDDPYDPNTNAYRGLRWLQQTLRSGGSTSLALAGYNAGIARAKDPDLDWPEETQRYVFWGLNIYQDTLGEYQSSFALENWLSKGGSALCDRAAAEQQLD